jgi:small-conductance mechanosensitive channel
MVFDTGVALSWILFLALFPLAFFWLRRAWRILVRRDFSEVALKHGEAPADPQRWAPYEMVINGIAGIIAVFVIVSVIAIGIPYATWTAIAGSTIWCKFFASFALSRHAHAFAGKGKAGRGS